MLKTNLETLEKYSKKLPQKVNNLKDILDIVADYNNLTDWEQDRLVEGITEISKIIHEINKNKDAFISNISMDEEHSLVSNDKDTNLVQIIETSEFSSKIRINKQMLHRRYWKERHFEYEQELLEKARECRKIKGKCLVIYEHLYPPNETVFDNDNYSVWESKKILDLIVDAKLISSDKGDKTSILHTTTVVKDIDEAKTNIHIVSNKKAVTYLEGLLKIE